MKHQNSDTQRLRLSTFFAAASLSAALFLFSTPAAHATNYSGNGNTGFGGPIGAGVLSLTDDGTNISGALSCAGHQMNDCLVIYVDTGAGGGFADTSSFGDNADGERRSISGFNGGTTRSVMTFMSGFAPQYALALGPSDNGFGGLWGLASGGANSLVFKASVGLLPLDNHGPYTFSFPASNLGLTPGVKTTIKIFGTLTSATAYRSTEAIAGNDSGTQGVNPFTQTAMATYTFAAGTTSNTPVSVSVDMSAMVTNGFNPGNGDTVYVTGSFVSTPGTLVPLTNNPAAANTNIYSGTAQDPNPTNTAETFVFAWIPNGNASTNYEDSDHRPFTLQAGGQTLPTVYFSDLAASPSATTNSVTFQVDMASAITLGTFNPSTQVVEAYGTFNQYYDSANTVPVQWAKGMGQLTQVGSSTVYSGTFPDGNYPGSWEQYKFIVITPGTSTNYESIANRDFVTPNGSVTLPVTNFNNINNVFTVAVTFQVDMTAQVEAGNLSTNGTTVNVGVFNVTGFHGGVLTNTNAANSNIYYGTFSITGPPTQGVQYKYEIVTATTTNYENPSSTDGGNRLFTLGSNPTQTLPLFYWSDQDPNNDLPTATQVTFTVDMTGAVDENGVAFNSSTDDIMIDGDFLPGGWNNALWTDATPASDFPTEVMGEVGLSSVYTATFTVPAGNPLLVNYKYAIWHNATSGVNPGTIDNEAPPNNDHHRYIRAVGTYNFPVDTFGSQTNVPPTGLEPITANTGNLGSVTATRLANGQIALSWPGRPGIYLQMSTNLASKVWTTVPNSGVGISATNITAGSGNVFFRLINP